MAERKVRTADIERAATDDEAELQIRTAKVRSPKTKQGE